MAEAKDGSARGAPARGSRTLSQRLLRALTGEVRALERVVAAKPPADGAPDPGAAAQAAGAKLRVDAIGNLTKTLEKLLELARLETLAAEGRREDEGEAERLRAELMKRLKAIDRRRGDGRRLFADLGTQTSFA